MNTKNITLLIIYVLCALFVKTVKAQLVGAKTPILINRKYINELQWVLKLSDEMLKNSEVNDGKLFLSIDRKALMKLKHNNIDFKILKRIQITQKGTTSNQNIQINNAIPEIELTYDSNLIGVEYVTFYLKGKNSGDNSSDGVYITMSFPQYSNLNDYGGDFLIDDVNKLQEREK